MLKSQSYKNILNFSSLNQRISNKEALKCYIETFNSTKEQKRRFGGKLILLSIMLLCPVLLWSAQSVIVLFWFFAFALLGFGAQLLYVIREGRKVMRLRGFAQDNNFSYFAESKAKEHGIYSTAGNNQAYTDCLLGQYNGKAISISNFHYVTGSGKSRSEHTVGIIDVMLKTPIPNILLDSNKNNLFDGLNISGIINDNQKCSLEGDFDKYFTLYAPKDYQRDVLYFLTPELMALLVEKATDYDIETTGDLLKFYKPGGFNFNEESLSTMFALIDSLGGEFIENTDKYVDERSANISAAGVGGARLKRSQSQFIAVAVVVILIVFLLQLIPLLGMFA